MATLIKNTDDYAFYLTEDEDSHLLTNNTPGEIDLAILVEGTDYVKLNRPFRDRLKLSSKYANIWSVKDGKMNYTSYGDQHLQFQLSHTIKESTLALTYTAEEKFMTFWRLHRDKGDAKIYVINRIGTNTWAQYPNAAGTLKKYAPIVIHDFEFIREYKQKNLTIDVIATIEAIWAS